jgi:hypothetical protein
VGGRKKKNTPPPDLTLGEANHLVARLGGFADRKLDGQPGAESFGIGWHRLMDMAYGWSLHKKHALSSRAKFV